MEDKKLIKKPIMLEFKSGYDWSSQKFHRLGDKNKTIDSPYYRKSTNEDLDDLTVEEKLNLIERATKLHILVNEELRKFIY